MKDHWNKTNNEGDLPDLTNTLYGIHYQINKNEKVSKLGFIDYFTRIAAILILPITIALIYLASQDYSSEPIMRTISTPLASRTSFVLPDGSEVWLNSGSSVSFPNRFSKTKRQITLTGQAYFDVKKDNVPFEIKTGNFKVNVLGTAFDVSAYKNETPLVTLVRGKVEIETTKGKAAVLKPGQQAVIETKTGNINTQKVNSRILTAWKDNVLVFENESIEDAILRLERWFSVDIELADDAIKDIKLTGTFQFEGIGEILHLLEITNSIKYTYNEEQRKLILKLK